MELLPTDILTHIQSFLPINTIARLTKTNYTKYHATVIKIPPKKYDSFMRMLVMRDYSFVFRTFLDENSKNWLKKRNYPDNCYAIYANFFYFLYELCVKHQSEKCLAEMLDKMEELGLRKNLHKKNIVKNIRNF